MAGTLRKLTLIMWMTLESAPHQVITTLNLVGIYHLNFTGPAKGKFCWDQQLEWDPRGYSYHLTLLAFYFLVDLNNIKETDFVNVTVHSLMRVTPLIIFFLIPEHYQHSKSPLVHRFGEQTLEIWHARNFG
ncbi:unnamed protein product [Urochloa humidicola]